MKKRLLCLMMVALTSCKPENPVITSIALDKSALSLSVGDNYQLAVSYTPSNLPAPISYTWKSSDSSVATVDDKGKVTAVKIGNATITATASYLDLIPAVCDITVSPTIAQGMRLNNSSLTIDRSYGQTLRVEFTPENTTNKDVVWSSSDNNIATVNKGLVIGVKEGEAIITVKSAEGNLEATCRVEVKLQGLAITKNAIQTLPNQQESIQVNYSTGSEAYIGATWASSDPSVATVTKGSDESNSAIVETKALGSAVITATSSDGSKTAMCKVHVVGIVDLMSLNTSGAFSSINGYLTGQMYSHINNNSPCSIELTSFYIYNGQTGVEIAHSTDPTQLGVLKAGSSTNLGASLRFVYCPIFSWTFIFEGQTYEVQHQYSSSFSSSDKKDVGDMVPLRLISE